MNEVNGWKASADQGKMQALKEENILLTSQILQSKAREVDMMNSMTEEIAARDSKVKLLEAELSEVRSGREAAQIQGLRNIVTTAEAAVVEKPPSEIMLKTDVHKGECNVAAFDPLGGLIATGGADKCVKVWDTRTFELQHSYSSPNASVVRLCFSPSGERLLAGCNDSSCHVFTIGENRPFCTLTGHTEKVWGAAFQADSRHVVTGAHDRSLRWWDLQMGGRCTKTVLCSSSCNDITVLPGSDLVCSAHFDNHVRLWDPRSYKLAETIENCHESQVTSVCVTPDGNGLLTSGRDSKLKIIDMRTYRATHTFACPDFIASINHYKACISPDSKYVAAGSSSRICSNNQTLCVWDMKQKVVARLCDTHHGPITCCTWHPDGTFLATTGHDGQLITWR